MFTLRLWKSKLTILTFVISNHSLNHSLSPSLTHIRKKCYEKQLLFLLWPLKKHLRVVFCNWQYWSSVKVELRLHFKTKSMSFSDHFIIGCSTFLSNLYHMFVIDFCIFPFIVSFECHALVDFASVMKKQPQKNFET